MKSNLKILSIVLGGVILISSCKKDTPGTTYYDQQDQVGRPAINTVFISASGKDSFNTTIPSQESATFSAEMKANLLGLTNPAGVYTSGNPNNALGLSADALIGVLSTDALNVSTKGPTKFFTSTSDFFTGRGLGDDVIDAELTLLFGGPTGAMNPTLTSDHVDANDKAFLGTFPYEASPW